ncbi:MAG: ABC transporter substrate-binding protein [Termitinemataceae bacterium]|nr:MAG: ABC transporter substrate-binding protein [Termitinemataceae bacterium]
MKRNKVVFLAFGCAVLAFIGCSKPQVENTIKIGGIFPLTGDVAVYGTEARNGAELAIEEINSAGGLLGKNLELISEDDEGKAEITVNAYNKLTAKDKVKFIIGSLTSGCTKAISSKAQSQKVLLIAPAATANDITDAGDYIFRTCFTDSAQGTAGGIFTGRDLDAKTVAVLFNVSSDYSIGLKDNFIAAYQEFGGSVVAVESYNEPDVDFNAQITKIKALEPQVIYIPDYYTKVALIVSQLRGQGIASRVVGTDGWDGIIDKIGDAAAIEGGFYTNHYASGVSAEIVKNFVSSYTAKYNAVPTAFAALAYDSVYMLKDAIIAADNGRSTEETPVIPTSTEVRDALAAVSGKYITGDISFDAKHNPVKPVVVVEILRDENDNRKLITKYRTKISTN